MPLRPTVCYRAVHQRITTNSDALWITDEILSNAYKRFCAITKPARRYGSHVPGPMESRRRTGKRRMAHMTEMGHDVNNTPLNDFAALWQALGTRDPMNWRWEPPAASLPAKEENVKQKVELPAWLTDFTSNPPPIPQSITQEIASKEVVESEGTKAQDFHSRKTRVLREDLRELRELSATAESLPALYPLFNQKIEQKLMLGLVSGDELASCLRTVTKYLKHWHSQKRSWSKFCLRFYQAVWNGVTSSRVMTLRDFKGRVLNQFLCLLSMVTHNPDVELLATRILQSLSEEQLLQVNEGILAISKSWALSWRGSADANVPQKDPSIVEASVLALANALNFLPREKASDIVRQLTPCFSKECRKYGTKELGSFPQSWLNLAAHVKGVDESLFIQVWKAIDLLMGHTLTKDATEVPSLTGNISLSDFCDVVLNHWTSCDLVEDSASVRETITALMVNRPPNHRLSCLIAALDQKRQLAWRKSQSLFLILRNLGLYPAIYETLRHLPELGIKYPVAIISAEIKAIRPEDYDVAFKIYKLYPKLHIDRKCMTTRLDGQAPEFYLQMIRDEMIPKDIWCLLRIPLYHPLWSRPVTPRHRRGLKTLHPHRISLIRRMALEFAHAKHLSPRQARRNVAQCLLYLKKHCVSIRGKPDLTRAVVHAGVTRELMRGKWVGTMTLRWVLRWVQIAEGEEVAEKLERVLLAWREEAMEKQRRERRDANPLGVGLID